MSADSGVHDVATNEEFGHTASDVATALRREGVKAVLTSLFPIEKMTAAEREREDAVREGIEIVGGVMPLEVIKDEGGLAVGVARLPLHNEGDGSAADRRDGIRDRM